MRLNASAVGTPSSGEPAGAVPSAMAAIRSATVSISRPDWTAVVRPRRSTARACQGFRLTISRFRIAVGLSSAAGAGKLTGQNMPSSASSAARFGASSAWSTMNGPSVRSSKAKAARSTRVWKAASFGTPSGRPNSYGTQSARGGVIFSVCGRIRLMETVGRPAASR